MKQALIVYGGWDGHAPEETAKIFVDWLKEENISVTVSDSLEAFNDLNALERMDLIVVIWTMGKLSKEQSSNVSAAVAGGVGLAGCHGGLCDAFRDDVEWQFMTGGQWVSHPGNDGVAYQVNIRNSSSPITKDLQDFPVKSEQYYMHVDPAVEVLATTRFPVADGPHRLNGAVDMPQVWTKRWGTGRVYYNALGHQPDIWDVPEAAALMKRGLLWASRD